MVPSTSAPSKAGMAVAALLLGMGAAVILVAKGGCCVPLGTPVTTGIVYKAVVLTKPLLSVAV